MRPLLGDGPGDTGDVQNVQQAHRQAVIVLRFDRRCRPHDPRGSRLGCHRCTRQGLYTELDKALDRQEELEAPIFANSAAYDEAELLEDPQWISLYAELDSLHEAEARAAVSLIRSAPSTVAGATARTRYIAALASRGYQWADAMLPLDHQSRSES